MNLQITFYKTAMSLASLYGCEMWAIKEIGNRRIKDSKMMFLKSVGAQK